MKKPPALHSSGILFSARAVVLTTNPNARKQELKSRILVRDISFFGFELVWVQDIGGNLTRLRHVGNGAAVNRLCKVTATAWSFVNGQQARIARRGEYGDR